MDESKMTPAAQQIHDAVMAEVWSEWITQYMPGLIQIEPPPESEQTSEVST